MLLHYSAIATRHKKDMPNSGSKSQLYAAKDSNDYVVKLQGNPFGSRSLATEMIAALLLKELQLPVPDFALIEIPAPLLPPGVPGLQPGIAWGSLFNSNAENAVFRNDASKLAYPDHASGLVVFDHWSFNWDRANRIDNIMIERKQDGIHLLFIDQNICFAQPI